MELGTCGRFAETVRRVLAAKAALYEALREQRLSNSAFAAAMGIQESEVRRMLDPRHATKIGRLEEAFKRPLQEAPGGRSVPSGFSYEQVAA